MNACASIAKYVLFILNLIFVVAGLVIVGFASYLIYTLKVVESGEFPIALAAILVSGLLIALFSFCGCCGAIKEVKWMLIIYAFALLVVSGLQIYFTVVLMDGRLKEVVEDLVQKAFDISKPEEFYEVEKYFGCCGVTGRDSYTSHGKEVPASCCVGPIHGLCSVFFRPGCQEVLGDIVKDFASPIAYSSIGLIVLEIISMAFAIIVAASVNEGAYYY